MARPRKEAADKKTAHLSTRFRADLRERLQAAADANGVKLSEEVSNRLQLSFEMDEQIEKRFGGKRNYWVFQLVADQIKYLEHVTGHSYWEDRYTFDQAKSCLATVFNTLRPRGRSTIPKALFVGFGKRYREREARSLGERCALLAIANLQAAARLKNATSTPWGAQNFAAAGTMVAQLVKSDKSPLDDLTAQWPKQKKRMERELTKLKEKQEQAK
jgi:hypothetical protein